MFKRIDRSQTLLNLLAKISDLFAKQRGLPVIIGVFFVVISMIVQSIAVFTDSTLIEFLGVITHNLGVLIALIGMLMVTPLGGR